MNVYKILGHGSYCAGVSIVAANSIDEALSLAQAGQHTGYSGWGLDYYLKDKGFPDSPDYNSIQLPLTFEGTVPQVITAFAYGE